MPGWLVWVAWLAVPAGQANSPKLAADAEAARQQGSPEAAALFERALQANPAWQEGWWALGTLRYRKDDFPACRDAFQKLSVLAPKSGPALTMLGLCEFGATQYDAALEHLREGQDLGVLNQGIDRVAKYQLAKLCTRAGMFEAALGLLGQLAESSEENPGYIMQSGLAALWRPLFAEDAPPAGREMLYLAGKAFWHAGGRNAGDAENELKELAAKYPSEPGVHYFFGSFELRNDPDRAVAEFERELQIQPGHIGALSALAAEYLRRGDTGKGLAYARQLVAALPGAMASHTLLGRLLVEKGDLAEGAAELEKARELDPSDPQPHIALASLYAKLGRKEDAARERREFLRLKDGTKK